MLCLISRQVPRPRAESVDHAIELIDPPPAALGAPAARASVDPAPRRTRPRAAAGTRARAHPSLSALTPSLRSSLDRQGDIAASASGSQGGVGDAAFDDPNGYRMALLPEGEQEATGLIEALYRRINGRLVFDSLLAEHGHFGAAYAEFTVDRRGRLIDGSLRAGGKDRVLKVYALRSALLPALAQGFPESLWMKDIDEIQLRAQFQFIWSDKESSLFDKTPAAIAGRALTFRRFSARKPAARSVVAQLRDDDFGFHLGEGIVAFDPLAAVNAWQTFLKAREQRRSGIDPFAILKADPFY